MEFIFETDYDQKAITVMARALRKTIRRKRSRRSLMLGILVILLGIIFSIPPENQELQITSSFIVTWIAIIVMCVVLVFQDKINAYFARNFKIFVKWTTNL